MRRAADEPARGFVVIAHINERVIPRGFRAHDGQRHVYALERHQVDFALPLVPAPPCGRVADSAIVHVRAAALTDYAAHGGARRGQNLRQRHVAAAARYARADFVLKVCVQRARHGYRVVAAQYGSAVARVHLPHVVSVFGGYLLQRELRAAARQQTFYHAARGFHKTGHIISSFL